MDSKGRTSWSKENKVITVKCKDSGIGCRKNEFSSSIGKEGEVSENRFTSLPDYLEAGEMMVFNNTKVIQPRASLRLSLMWI